MFFQIVSLADHLGNPRLGMKSEDSDYQGSSEKITFNFRQITCLLNNIASFYNDNNKFLNGRSKIKYCRGFGMNGVTLIYRAIIQTHSQAKKTRRNESHHSSSSCSQDMTSMDISTVAYFINECPAFVSFYIFDVIL